MKLYCLRNSTARRLCCISFCLLIFPAAVLADETLVEIKTELDALRSEYEQRIQSLEERLLLAEQQLTAQAEPASTGSAITSRYATASNQYNPAIGIILDGETWAYRNNPDGQTIPGFALGGESGLADEGISIGESEFVFTGNVDNWFYAQITAAIEQEDGEFEIGLEEAFVETLSLPASTTLRVGRFFSGIGYLNDKHKHTWDFADQALPYRAFLGNQYGDDGIQLRWLAPTDFFLELGAEVFRGSNYPAGGNANSGFGVTSLFARTGGDIGNSHSWTAGMSWLGSDALTRASGDEDNPLIFSGSSDIYIADLVWKWAPNGNSRQRNAVFQAEYLWRNETGQVLLPSDTAFSTRLDQNSHGWYAQASYQWMPRWRAGVRMDQLSAANPGSAYIGTSLDPQGHTPRRYSFMLDFSNSEFSRFRLQFNRDETSLKGDNQIGLQYIMSIGAHGGHEF